MVFDWWANLGTLSSTEDEPKHNRQTEHFTNHTHMRRESGFQKAQDKEQMYIYVSDAHRNTCHTHAYTKHDELHVQSPSLPILVKLFST